jgi:hypothetical protein
VANQSDSSQPLVPRIPAIDSDWWRICEMPDLRELNGPNPERQHVVDHGFIQATNGKWQLWACIRGAAVGRLLYAWEGDDLEHGPWEPRGIAARAQKRYGESAGKQEGIGAPFFVRIDGVYYCFYHSGGIHVMTSEDGVHYERKLNAEGKSLLYPDGGRDVMMLKIGETWFSYSTVTTVSGDGWRRGFNIVRTSTDLVNWSDYSVVCEGGRAGNGGVSAESPFVVALDGFYYLFRATSTDFRTYVYRSEDPYHFGINDDSKLIAVLPIKAPEIVHHDDQWYISDLADFQGIKLARLRWDPA